MAEEIRMKYSSLENAFVTEKLVGNVGKTMGKYSKDHYILTPEEAIYISQVQSGAHLYSESGERVDEWKVPHYATQASQILAFSQLRTSGAAIQSERDGFALYKMDPDRPFRKSDPGPKLATLRFGGIEDDPVALLRDLDGSEVICLSEEGRCHYVKVTALGDSLNL